MTARTLPLSPSLIAQGLALALLLVEFELEQPQVDPPPEGWIADLEQARVVLAELKESIAPVKSSPPDALYVPPGRCKERRARLAVHA